MLSEKMRNKMKRAKSVGHDKGSVVPHSLMNEWIEQAEQLEGLAPDPNEVIHRAIILCEEDPMALEMLRPKLKKLLELMEAE